MWCRGRAYTDGQRQWAHVTRLLFRRPGDYSVAGMLIVLWIGGRREAVRAMTSRTGGMVVVLRISVVVESTVDKNQKPKCRMRFLSGICAGWFPRTDEGSR